MTSSRKLRLTTTAKRDLASIASHSRREWGVAQKRKYLARIKDTFRALRNSPGIGAARDDIVAGIRAHPVGSHLVFYRETGTVVVILRVLHERMDVESRLMRRAENPPFRPGQASDDSQ